MRPLALGSASSLTFDDKYTVDFDLLGQGAILMATALLPQGSDNEFPQRLSTLLNVGLALSTKTHGALTIDEEKKAIIHYDTFRVEGSADEKSFQTVDRFVNEVAAFHVILERQPGLGRSVDPSRARLMGRS